MLEADLNLVDPKGTGQNYCPSVMLSDGKGGYIGAFRDTKRQLAGWLDEL